MVSAWKVFGVMLIGGIGWILSKQMGLEIGINGEQILNVLFTVGYAIFIIVIYIFIFFICIFILLLLFGGSGGSGYTRDGKDGGCMRRY